MKLKIRMTLIVSAIIVVILVALMVTVISLASSSTLDVTLESQERLAQSQAFYWVGRQSAHLRGVQELATLFGHYKEIA
jgi:hypothetical protein